MAGNPLLLKRASTFIIVGVVCVWLLTHIPPSAPPASSATWAGIIGHALAPVMQPIGIDPLLTIALIFGFIAKEILIGSLAVIYGREGDALIPIIAAQMDWIKAYSFMLFTLLYTPCLSTIATLRSESKSIWLYPLCPFLGCLLPPGLSALSSIRARNGWWVDMMLIQTMLDRSMQIC